jgi:hypothetical protein
MRKTHLARLLLAVLMFLALVGQSRAADPDPRLIAKGQKFLEDDKRAKSVLSFAHFGATYRGAECRSWTTVVDEKKQPLTGYFALTMRYYWAGLVSDDEHTDLVFFFDDNGRFYGLRDGETTSKFFKPFELSKAVIDLTKEAIRASVKDSDKDTKASVEAAIRDVDAKAMLRLKLMLEQP